MSKTIAHEYNTLRQTFNGVAITNISASAGTTQLWLGLHTADPGNSGSTANEGGYASYTRVAVQRSTAGFVVTSGTTQAGASPVAPVTFPQNTSTSTGTFSFASVYPASNSTGVDALYNGSISPVVNFSQNVTPSLTTGSSITES